MWENATNWMFKTPNRATEVSLITVYYNVREQAE